MSVKTHGFGNIVELGGEIFGDFHSGWLRLIVVCTNDCVSAVKKFPFLFGFQLPKLLMPAVVISHQGELDLEN